jgi:hypothetical protein
MSSTPCELVTLVKSATSHIQFCADCGEVHLTMGPISLRLSRDHYQRLSSDIAKGLYRLEMPDVSLEMLHDQSAKTLHS